MSISKRAQGGRGAKSRPLTTISGGAWQPRHRPVLWSGEALRGWEHECRAVLRSAQCKLVFWFFGSGSHVGINFWGVFLFFCVCFLVCFLVSLPKIRLRLVGRCRSPGSRGIGRSCGLGEAWQPRPRPLLWSGEALRAWEHESRAVL